MAGKTEVQWATADTGMTSMMRRMGVMPLISVFSLAFVYSFRRMSDTDLWGHLKCGEYLFQYGRILKTYYFNCSWPDLPYLNHEWLFQGIIYSVYRYAGEPGLIALQIFLIMLAFAMLYRILRLWSDDLSIIALVMGLGVMASSHRFALRPQHFTYVFLLYFLMGLHHLQRGDRRYAWFMGPVMVLWVNIHAESLWGLLIPLVYLFTESATGLRYQSGRGRIKAAGIVLVSVIAASMLNPFSYKTVFWPIFVMKEQFGGVEEILPPTSGRFLFFWIYFALFALTSLVNFRRVDWTWGGLSLIFLVVAWTANRGIPHFVFVSAPVVVSNLEALLRRPSVRWKGYYGAICTAVITIFFSGYATAIVTSPTYFKKYDNYSYPEGALHFLEEHKISGNVFNHHPWGNYIIWNAYPSLKPYIDGRFFHRRLYDEFNHVLQVGSGWQDILQKYGISMVLLPYSETDNGTLSDRLFASLQWRLVYWDDVSLLYLKDGLDTADIIDRFGNNVINPDRQMLDYAESDPQLLGRARKAADQGAINAPDSYKAALLSASIRFRMEDYAGAISMYEAALNLARHDVRIQAWCRFKMADSFRRLGDMGPAESHARAALALVPDFKEALKMIAEISLLRESR